MPWADELDIWKKGVSFIFVLFLQNRDIFRWEFNNTVEKKLIEVIREEANGVLANAIQIGSSN